MQGFDKLGNSISSAIKAPMEAARNKTIAEYYQNLKDTKFYADGMKEIAEIDRNIEADNKQIQANKDAEYKAQMKDQAAVARKMAHIAAMQKSIETMQANNDLHTYRDLIKEADKQIKANTKINKGGVTNE